MPTSPCPWLLDVEPGEKVTWKVLARTHLRLVRISTVGSARIGVSCRGLSPAELDIHDTLCNFSQVLTIRHNISGDSHAGC